MLAWLAFLLALAGLFCNLLSVASAVVRLAKLQKPRVRRTLTTTVILPITGAAEGLETVIAALEGQTLPPRRLIVSVESRDDPAYARANQSAGLAHLPVTIVVAGESRGQAQKCHNQQAALALIDADDEAIVLMDGDIVPQDWWLSALVSPLADGRWDLVTGHRWQRLAGPKLGAHLAAAIDRGVTLLPRFDWNWTTVVWGGSLGISVAAAKRMDLGNSLDGTLSDDLSLADRAAASGLRILTRGSLLVPSPTALDLPSAWRFGVRQYRIGHIYRPWLWRLAVVAVNLRLAGWVAAIWQVAATGEYIWMLAGLVGLAVLKQYLVGEIGRRLDMPDPTEVRAGQLLLGLVQPLVDLFHSSIVFAAARTHRVRWGHVLYEVAGPNAITVKERLPFPAS